jgi:hypothetical protein
VRCTSFFGHLRMDCRTVCGGIDGSCWTVCAGIDDSFGVVLSVANCFGAPLLGARGFLGFRPLLLGMEPSGFAQALAECGDVGRERHGRCPIEEPDHRNRRLLRAGGERPRCRRSAEKRDELAASHVEHGLPQLKGPQPSTKD